jgi:hypothetical protein
VTGYQTFLVYQSIRLHFTHGQSYDATRYNFKTSAKESSFNSRKDRFFFERIGRKYQSLDRIVDYFTANFLIGLYWIGDMREENLNDFDKRMDSLSYRFETDLRTLHEECDSFDKICTTSIAFDLLIPHRINFETVTIMDILVDFCNRLRSDLSDPLGMYDEQIQKVLKYKLLLRRRDLPYDKLKNIVKKVFTK